MQRSITGAGSSCCSNSTPSFLSRQSPSTPCTVTPNKNRHALNKALTLDLQRGGERLAFAVPDLNVFLIGAPRTGGRPKRVTDEDVLAALADGPVTHDDLREKLDASRGTLRQRLKSLEEAGRALIDRSKKPHAISAVERS